MAGSLRCARARSSGMCSGCWRTGHRDEYDAVCASWRELSRNKSRDEREMWPNRSSHTDTVFHGCSQREAEREKGRGRGISPFSIPRLFSMAVPSTGASRSEFSSNFTKGHLGCQRSAPWLSPSFLSSPFEEEIPRGEIYRRKRWFPRWDEIRYDAFKSSE